MGRGSTRWSSLLTLQLISFVWNWKRSSCLFVFLLSFLLSLATTVCTLEVATVANENIILDQSLHFEVLWPETLKYTYKIRPAQNFGSAFNRVYQRVELVLADPDEACQQLYNSVRGTVVLAIRGGCSFLTKTKKAEEGGALAVIISDNDVNNYDKMIDMIDDDTHRAATIPSLFMVGKDGDMIRRHLLAARTDRTLITIPVNMTGRPVHASRRPPWTVW